MRATAMAMDQFQEGRKTEEIVVAGEFNAQFPRDQVSRGLRAALLTS